MYFDKFEHLEIFQIITVKNSSELSKKEFKESRLRRVKRPRLIFYLSHYFYFDIIVISSLNIVLAFLSEAKWHKTRFNLWKNDHTKGSN